MKIVNFEQTSDEWLDWRRGKMTASRIACAMNRSPFGTAYSLWCEIVLGKVKPMYMPAVDRGRALEEPARYCAEQMLGMTFTPLCVESDENPSWAASLDGYNPENDVVIEIKAPGKEVLAKAEKGIIPDEYFLQIQWQLLVTGAKKACYFCYSGLSGMAIWVEPCPDTFEKMKRTAIEFQGYVDRLEEPDLTDQDVIDDNSVEWLEFARLKIQTAEALRQAQFDDDTVKAKLEQIAGTRARIRGGGVLYTQTKRPGNINYKSVVESLDISDEELEKFRGSPVTTTRITITKSRA